MCDGTLRETVATPPTFIERTICDTCQVIWQIEINTQLQRVTFFDESGVITPESFSFDEMT
jgi:hypothetical protein